MRIYIPDQTITLKNAEELGYEGITVPDHLVCPTQINTPYPYTSDGKVW